MSGEPILPDQPASWPQEVKHEDGSSSQVRSVAPDDPPRRPAEGAVRSGAAAAEEERRARAGQVRRCRNAGALLVSGCALASVGALLTYLGETVTFADDHDSEITTTSSLTHNDTTAPGDYDPWEEVSGVMSAPQHAAAGDTDLKVIGPFILALGAVMAAFGAYYALKAGVKRVAPWSGHEAGSAGMVPMPDPLTSQLAVSARSPIPEGGGTLSVIVGAPQDGAGISVTDISAGGDAWASAGYQPLSIAAHGTAYTNPLRPQYRPAYDTSGGGPDLPMLIPSYTGY